MPKFSHRLHELAKCPILEEDTDLADPVAHAYGLDQWEWAFIERKRIEVRS